MNTNGSNLELECYLKIIDSFQNAKHQKMKLELVKSNSIINLIRTSKCKNYSNFIKNALMLVLTLYDKKPLDLYNARGDMLEDCNDQQKSTLLSRLKKEIF